VYVEIEAKLKVDSFEVVEGRLKDAGALFVSQRVQTDCYFDTAEPNLARTDQALRLRTESDADGRRLILTYKGPKQVDDFKKRKEVNLEITDAEGLKVLLDALGYTPSLAFDKRRSVWQFEGCEVALDELPLLGTFVEIEGPDSAVISRVRQALGLTEAPHVVDSYACLIERELDRLGSTQREVFLPGDGSSRHEAV